MKLRIITFIAYTNIHTVQDLKKELKCDDVHIALLQASEIIQVHPPHNIVTLTPKGSDIYGVLDSILNLAL